MNGEVFEYRCSPVLNLPVAKIIRHLLFYPEQLHQQYHYLCSANTSHVFFTGAIVFKHMPTSYSTKPITSTALQNHWSNALRSNNHGHYTPVEQKRHLCTRLPLLMSALRTCAREGNVIIPLRSLITIELAYSRDGETGVYPMYTNFPVEPLVLFSKACRRALLDKGQDSLTLHCGEMRVPVTCYDQVIRWLGDLHTYWPRNSKISREYTWPSNVPAPRMVCITISKHALMMRFGIYSEPDWKWI